MKSPDNASIRYYKRNRDKLKQRMQDRYRRLKAEHRCTQCACELPKEYPYVKCPFCYAKSMAKRNERR